MAERIQVPPTLLGDTKNNITQIYNYLFRLSEVLNRNLGQIGDNSLTEREQNAMRGLSGGAEAESLKDMVVAIAADVQKLNSSMSEAEQKIRYLNNLVLNMDTDETDLDEVTEPGVYWLEISAMTHKPAQFTTADRNFPLNVMTDGTDIIQTINSGANLFLRIKHGGSWSSWSTFTQAT